MDTDKTLINRSKATELFAQMVFDTGYKEGLVAPFDDMAHSFGDEKLQKAVETFQGLNDDEKACFRFLLGKAVYAALFHVLVNLDGATGYHEITGHRAEFTLGLRVFQNGPSKEELGPVIQEISIAPTESGEDLHDIFAGLVDEAER